MATTLRYLPQYEKYVLQQRARDYQINGETFRRVSTMLGVINKPALMPWASKTMGTWLTEHLNTFESRSELYHLFTDPHADMDLNRPPLDEYQIKGSQDWRHRYALWILNTTAAMRDSVKEATNKAANRGTEVHDMLCHALKDLPNPDQIRNYMGVMLEPESDTHCRVADGLQYIIDNGYTVAASEMIVWDDNTKVAGTCDFVGYAPDGRLVIWDWKTGSGPWWEMALQLGAYAALIQRVTGEYPADAYILKLTDDGAVPYRIADPKTGENALPDATHAFFQQWASKTTGNDTGFNREVKPWDRR